MAARIRSCLGLVTRCFGLVCLTCGAAPAHAQRPPDAGRLLEQIRPSPTLPQGGPPDIRREEAPTPADGDGPRIRVRRLRITGVTRFAEAELHALIAGGEGRELSLGDLQSLAERLTNHYRAHGFLLARAYLPAQDVVNGEIEIAVLEGRLGRLIVSDTSGLGGSALAPLSLVSAGEVAHGQSIERSLLLLSDLPGTEVRSTLRPGATVGTTDLLVDVAPGRRVAGSVDVDTYGNRYSGRNRIGASITANNPLGIGDQASLRSVASDEGLKYARAAYQAPVNAWGTRIGLAVAEMSYSLGKDFAPLQVNGEATTRSAYGLHPWVRSRARNINAILQYDHLALEDRIGSTNTTVNKVLRNWRTGISGDWRDGLGGGAETSFSLIYTTGRLRLDPDSESIDAITLRTSGRFSKVNGTLSRLQRVGDDAGVHLSVTGQLASKNLDSVEKMSLGGADGVRAYPQGEAPGDAGFLVTLEARHRLDLGLPGDWQVAAFLDAGRVRQYKNPLPMTENSRRLSGAGIGLTAAPTGDWSIKASLAWRLGSSKPVSEDDRMPRAWVQAIRFF